jgi:hypothetical protein
LSIPQTVLRSQTDFCIRVFTCAFLETPAHLSNGHTLPANPFVNLTDDPSLFPNDLITRLPAPLVFGDVVITIGSAAQDTHVATLSGVTFATPAALHDLRPLVFRHNSLDFKEQRVLGSLAQAPV